MIHRTSTEERMRKEALRLKRKALRYRDGNRTFARFDLQAVLDGVPGAIKRLGGPEVAVKLAIEMLAD